MKKILYTIIIIIGLLTTNVSALESNLKINNEFCKRTESNNYYVHKKWKINSNNLNNILNTPCVDSTKKIYDFSNILTDLEEKELKKYIDEFIEKYNTELIIVTYDLKYTIDSQNDTFASDFYDYNDFGLNNRIYDGIVLFRNTYSADPYFDIYTFGEAQLYFTHNRYDTILDGIYPYLKSHNYYVGFKKFIEYVDNTYKNGIPNELKYYTVDDMGYLIKHKAPYEVPWVIALIISFVISLIITCIKASKNKMVKTATEAKEYLDNNNIIFTKKSDTFIREHTTQYTVSSSSSGGGGYHSSSGSSGGGFSSGGGRHG